MEIRRSSDRLISTMGFPILVRYHLYIESGPWWSITTRKQSAYFMGYSTVAWWCLTIWTYPHVILTPLTIRYPGTMASVNQVVCHSTSQLWTGDTKVACFHNCMIDPYDYECFLWKKCHLSWSHYLSQCWPRSMSPLVVLHLSPKDHPTRTEWIEFEFENFRPK